VLAEDAIKSAINDYKSKQGAGEASAPETQQA
jgi:NifU-like protein involved in Fe-S cluster formation